MEPITGFVKTLGISGIITLAMALFYKIVEGKLVSDSLKTWIVVGIGGLVGVFYLFYSGDVATFQSISDHILYGLKEGLTAIGLFKVGQAIGLFTPPTK